MNQRYNLELAELIGVTEHGDLVYAPTASSVDDANQRTAARLRSERLAPGTCAACGRPCHYRLFVDDDVLPWCCGRFACECRLRGETEPSAAHTKAATARDAEFRRLQAVALAAAGVSDEFADDITERDAPLAYAAMKALREALDVAPGGDPMSRLEAARDLLVLLTAAIPPPEHQHHGLTLLDGGKGLCLGVRADGTGYTFHLDESDLARSPEAIFADVMALWAKTDRSAARDGVA